MKEFDPDKPKDGDRGYSITPVFSCDNCGEERRYGMIAGKFVV